MKVETEETTGVQHSELALPADLLIFSEHPVYATRPLLWPFLIRPVIWALVGISVIGFAQQNQLTFLSGVDNIVSLGLIRTILMWIGLAVLFVGCIDVFVKYLRWRYTIYSVTNRRILHQTGIIGKSYIDCPISKVQTMYLRISVLGRVFDFGTIRVATAGTGFVEMQWKYVKEPRKAHRILSEVIEQYRLEGEGGEK